MRLVYHIDPTAKVRQTQSDKWNKRPCVVRFRAFADEVRRLGITVQDGDAITFRISMPVSWSLKEKELQIGQPHRSRPDLDNLLGGLMDAAMPDGDSHVAWVAGLRKEWGLRGAIVIDRQSEQSGPTVRACKVSL